MNALQKTTIKIITLIFLFTTISWTGNEKNKSINGIWIQEGYGRIIEITDSTYTYYNTTENSCLPLVAGKLKERFKIVRFTEKELVLNPGGIVNYYFKRSDTLPEICREEDTQIDNSPERNFEVFWSTFNKHYAFFKERNINWEKIREKYLPIAKNIKSDRELYELFVEVIKPFNDGHIKLDVPDSLSIAKKEKTGTENKKSKFDVSADILKHYVDNHKSYNKDVIRWGYLNNSEVGYILISDMNNFSNYISSSSLSEKEFQQQYDEKLDSKSPVEQFGYTGAI
jgi:carboxyl-terminal processing protease